MEIDPVARFEDESVKVPQTVVRQLDRLSARRNGGALLHRPGGVDPGRHRDDLPRGPRRAEVRRRAVRLQQPPEIL